MSRVLYVSYKHQHAKDVKHWEFSVQDANTSGKISYHMAFDIVMFGSTWSPRRTPRRPCSSPKYAGKTTLCEIGDSAATLEELRSVIEVINNQLILNATNYDCQDYVLDILDGLVASGIINPDDQNYREGMEELMDNYRK